MPRLHTTKVRHKKSKETMIINTTDFNAALHNKLADPDAEERNRGAFMTDDILSKSQIPVDEEDSEASATGEPGPETPAPAAEANDEAAPATDSASKKRVSVKK